MQPMHGWGSCGLHAGKQSRGRCASRPRTLSVQRPSEYSGREAAPLGCLHLPSPRHTTLTLQPDQPHTRLKCPLSHSLEAQSSPCTAPPPPPEDVPHNRSLLGLPVRGVMQPPLFPWGTACPACLASLAQWRSHRPSLHAHGAVQQGSPPACLHPAALTLSCGRWPACPLPDLTFSASFTQMRTAPFLGCCCCCGLLNSSEPAMEARREAMPMWARSYTGGATQHMFAGGMNCTRDDWSKFLVSSPVTLRHAQRCMVYVRVPHACDVWMAGTLCICVHLGREGA